MLSVRQKVKLVAFAQGIFVCYAIFGIFHEKIFKNRFGTEINEDGTHGERFTYAVAFVALQCIVYVIFSKGRSRLSDKLRSLKTSINEFLCSCFELSRAFGRRDKSEELFHHRNLLCGSHGDFEYGFEMDFLSSAGHQQRYEWKIYSDVKV